MEAIFGGIAGVIVALALCVSTVVWIAKKLVGSISAQQKTLIDGALENMQANTEAIQGMGSAFNALTQKLEVETVRRDGETRAMFHQLDRIEVQGRHK